MNDSVGHNAVLVVDDDPDYRGLVETFAQLWNIPVLQAADCKSALRILEHERQNITMILLDYFMPGMEPAKCVKAIVAKAGSSIEVVLVTASVDARARAGELKIKRWLAKPFDSSTLKRLLTDRTTSPGPSPNR